MPKISKEIKSQETLRFDEDELPKMQKIHERALKLNKGYAPKAHVIKELLGLLPPNLTTPADRAYLLSFYELEQAPPTPASGGKLLKKQR